MGVIFEESETDYPSFNMKKKPFLKNESEFEQVIDSILNENKEKRPFRRDEETLFKNLLSSVAREV